MCKKLLCKLLWSGSAGTLLSLKVMENTLPRDSKVSSTWTINANLEQPVKIKTWFNPVKDEILILPKLPT